MKSLFSTPCAITFDLFIPPLVSIELNSFRSFHSQLQANRLLLPKRPLTLLQARESCCLLTGPPLFFSFFLFLSLLCPVDTQSDQKRRSAEVCNESTLSALIIQSHWNFILDQGHPIKRCAKRIHQYRNHNLNDCVLF